MKHEIKKEDLTFEIYDKEYRFAWTYKSFVQACKISGHKTLQEIATDLISPSDETLGWLFDIAVVTNKAYCNIQKMLGNEDCAELNPALIEVLRYADFQALAMVLINTISNDRATSVEIEAVEKVKKN